MKIVIQGSKTFNDYNVFMRAIMVAMSPLIEEDDHADIYSVGPSKLNHLATGFVNITEDSMKARGLSLRMHRVPPNWVKDHIKEFDYFAYLSHPNEPVSWLAKTAEDSGVELGIFRY